ncbi:MAG: hypothetical protein IIX86_07390 [Clostridia bacterium]|nr:hypothetical protein [Clostridia bacterium]
MKKHILHARTLFALMLVLLLGGVLVSCASPADPLAATEFSSLTLDKNEVLHATVSVNLKEVEAHAGEAAYLYELLPGETLSAISSKQPLANAKISTQMKFSVPLKDGEHTRLYSTFAVCYEDGTPVTSTQKAVQNPTLLALSVTEFPWHKNPKGLCVSDAGSAASYGTAHAMAEIKLSALLAAGEYTFRFDGTDYAVSESALDLLDRRIQSSYLAGMKVSLRLIADTDCNTRTFTAVADLLTARYASEANGIVSAIFLETSDTDIERTEALATITMIALRSHVSTGQLFIVAPTASFSDTRLFFASLGERIATGTGFDWGAAIKPNETHEKPWLNVDTTIVCANTEQALFRDLRELKNPPAKFAVCDVAFSARDEETQSVALAYSYATAVKAGASMVFYRAQQNDEYGLLSSTGARRLALDMFCNVDATLSPSQTYLCKATSQDVWDVVSSLPTARRFLSGVGSHGAGSGNREMVFDFTLGDTYGFSATGGITLPTIEQSDAWKAPVLYTCFHAGNPVTVIRKILDSSSALSGVSMLSVQALAQYEKAKSCLFTLRLQGVDTRGQTLVFEAEAPVTAGSWQFATFSIAAFTAEMDPNAPCVMTLLTKPQTETDENFVFWVKAFYTYTPQNPTSVWIPIALTVGVAGASFLLFYLLYRRSRRPASREDD